jgi:pyruvate dehydrogenase E2 component (dihydrolipoamide acetyltransferase)
MSSESMQQFEFRLPDPGEGITDAEIAEWYVDEGDEVQEDEPLVDVETDKAVVEIPAPCTGIIEKKVVSTGDIVQVGDVIATFRTENPPRQQVADKESTTEETPTDDDPQEEIQKNAEDNKENEDELADKDRIFAAPSTRKYARKQGVDLQNVTGTGPEGRILRNDINRHLEAEKMESDDTDDNQSEATDQLAGDEPPSDKPNQEIVEPLRGLRRTIAENMQQSAQEIPHVTSGFEADATALVGLKERLNEKNEEIRITYTSTLVKALIPALKEYPLVNASIDMAAEEITKHQYYNIGVATHTEDGLVVPVIDNVDQKSLVEVAEELEQKVEAARNREIKPAALRGGTFTITNTGSHGNHGTFGTPIIRHPEAGILGVGTIKEKPIAVDGEPEIRDRINFSFSFDHRLIDGVTAGQFMERFIQGIEDPDILLSRL